MELLLLSVFCIINILLLVIQRKSFFNAANIVIGIYIIIALLNNFFAVRLGFFAVSNKNLLLLLILYLYAIIIVIIRNQIVIHFHKNTMKLCQTKIRKSVLAILDDKITYKNISFIFLMACIVRGIQILKILKMSGIETLGKEIGLSGIPSHLFLMVYPLGAYLFYYGLKKKKLHAIILYNLGLVISFASFVKYHAIFYLALTFLFCVFEDKKLGEKLFVFFGIGIVSLFVGNYIIGFAVSGVTTYTIGDYVYRMWDYIAGSIINGNHCLNLGKYNTQYTSWDLMATSVFPILNMLAKKIGIGNFEYKKFPLGFTIVSSKPSTSNVAGLIYNITYTGSYLLLLLLFTLIIWTTQCAIKKIKENNSNKLFYSMFITVNMMTFFANYYGLSTIWELLIWSYIIPKLVFNKRVILKYEL